MPLLADFLSAPKSETPSRLMALLAAGNDLTIPKRCAIANSATDLDEAAGVLSTAMFLLLAKSTSILSKPTPPLPITLRLGLACIRSVRTCVALRTIIASYSLSLTIRSAWGMLFVSTVYPAFSSSSMPDLCRPSFTNIFILTVI